MHENQVEWYSSQYEEKTEEGLQWRFVERRYYQVNGGQHKKNRNKYRNLE